MDVGGDPLTEAMRAVFTAAHERHGNEWIDADSARALVSGPISVCDRWGELQESKEKEQFARDLKIYNRRELNRITLEWRDPTKKLNRTKVRFFKKLEAKETDKRTPTHKNVPDDPECPRLTPRIAIEENKIKNNLEKEGSYSDPKPGTKRVIGDILDVPFEYVTDILTLQNAIALLASEPKDSLLALDIETYGPPPEMKGRKKAKDPFGPIALDPLRGSIRLLSLEISEFTELCH